jgi:hypothetical protein
MRLVIHCWCSIELGIKSWDANDRAKPSMYNTDHNLSNPLTTTLSEKYGETV